MPTRKRQYARRPMVGGGGEGIGKGVADLVGVCTSTQTGAADIRGRTAVQLRMREHSLGSVDTARRLRSRWGR